MVLNAPFNQKEGGLEIILPGCLYLFLFRFFLSFSGFHEVLFGFAFRNQFSGLEFGLAAKFLLKLVTFFFPM